MTICFQHINHLLEVFIIIKSSILQIKKQTITLLKVFPSLYLKISIWWFYLCTVHRLSRFYFCLVYIYRHSFKSSKCACNQEKTTFGRMVLHFISRPPVLRSQVSKRETPPAERLQGTGWPLKLQFPLDAWLGYNPSSKISTPTYEWLLTFVKALLRFS